MATHQFTDSARAGSALAVTGLTVLRDQHVRIGFTGEIDMATADSVLTAVTEAVRRHTPQQIDVDLASVAFMASSGIAALLRCQAYATECGCRLVVTNPQPMVYEIIRVTGLLHAFGVGEARR
ncbi:MAG TPA: STAS domain-containing protein [Micromonosporaceae bacterium]|nr:STAS domain-containing protein [Micromonosporaceae bacterium]